MVTFRKLFTSALAPAVRTILIVTHDLPVSIEIQYTQIVIGRDEQLRRITCYRIDGRTAIVGLSVVHRRIVHLMEVTRLPDVVEIDATMVVGATYDAVQSVVCHAEEGRVKRIHPHHFVGVGAQVEKAQLGIVAGDQQGIFVAPQNTVYRNGLCVEILARETSNAKVNLNQLINHT